MPPDTPEPRTVAPRPTAGDTAAEVRAIARLAGPIALAQFGLVTIGLVEIAILGRTSPAELGGASIGRSLNFLGFGLGIGIAAALEPLAAQAYGAGEPHTAWRAFLATLRAAALLAAPTAAFAIAASYALPLLGVEPALVAPARRFVVASSPGLFFGTTYLAAKSYLQAQKRTSPAVVAAVVSNATNVVVCSALVLGDEGLVRIGLPRVGLPALGALGAGIANLVANAVLAACVLFPAVRSRPRGEPPPESAVSVRKVLALGMPIGLQLLAEIGVFSLVAVLAGRLGTVAVSAHQIAIGLSSFTFMGVLGISGATSVRVGHAVGARRSPRRSGIVGIAMGAAFMAVCGIVFLTLPRVLVGLFTNDAAVADLGVRLVLIAAAFQLFDGIQGVAAGALRGAGDVRLPFVVMVLAYWFVGFPLALWLAFGAFGGGLAAPGLWWGLLVGLALVAGALTWRFVVISRGPIARV